MIPVFEGDQAYWWVINVEQHFEARGTPGVQKLPEVVRALRGRALNWYHWWNLRNPNATLFAFEMALLRRFQPEVRPYLPGDEERESTELQTEAETQSSSKELEIAEVEEVTDVEAVVKGVATTATEVDVATVEEYHPPGGVMQKGNREGKMVCKDHPPDNEEELKTESKVLSVGSMMVEQRCKKHMMAIELRVERSPTNCPTEPPKLNSSIETNGSSAATGLWISRSLPKLPPPEPPDPGPCIMAGDMLPAEACWLLVAAGVTRCSGDVGLQWSVVTREEELRRTKLKFHHVDYFFNLMGQAQFVENKGWNYEIQKMGSELVPNIGPESVLEFGPKSNMKTETRRSNSVVIAVARRLCFIARNAATNRVSQKNGETHTKVTQLIRISAGIFGQRPNRDTKAAEFGELRFHSKMIGSKFGLLPKVAERHLYTNERGKVFVEMDYTFEAAHASKFLEGHSPFAFHTCGRRVRTFRSKGSSDYGEEGWCKSIKSMG